MIWFMPLPPSHPFAKLVVFFCDRLIIFEVAAGPPLFASFLRVIKLRCERRPPHPLTIDAAARFRARSGCPAEVLQLARTRLTPAPRHTWRTSMWLRSVAGSTPRRGHADPRPATPKGTTRKLAPGPNSATAPMSTKIFLALPTAGASALYTDQPLSE